ncbi:monooxygenase [Paecilomyces variotii No. 5]|uniref:Monooxygenase n=1 Tax=Byssochlamys spectabilis (strain No. 5 / NBRC 109023) TaxID=1356009 RepID=V5HRC2_BYSSN|nr:monooxygenase [Paecilomyces variotii No. 5]
MTATVHTVPNGDYRDEDLITFEEATQRYLEERKKRLREDGDGQYIDIALSDEYRHFQDDPWVAQAAVKDIRTAFPDKRCEMLIIGAGLAGLCYAVRMIQAGVRPEDIRIIDNAGGFGGTWYWNRHPGLMCDTESYCYLPLLEETGYIPKHKYSHSEEIREYMNLVAEKWGVSERAVFQTAAQKLQWDEAGKEWQVDLIQCRKGEPPQTLNIRASFVVMANGLAHWPKLPGVPGLLDYKGDVFHPSRWAYDLTGGSPSDPSLTKLKDKRVAVIGTGATGVQIIPHLAQWAKHLYVVQRTPASVADRGQKETDPKWFRKEVATSKGWQRERMRNFHQHISPREKPPVNLVDDEWTRAPALVAITGLVDGPKSMEEIPAYVQKLNKLDHPRQKLIRERVDRHVKDPAIAEKLKPWYQSWCKRPCFHDEYLETFNRNNVTLIDTDGKGLDAVTTDSLVVGDQSYPVDMIIFATGYRNPLSGSVADKANAPIIGRNGISMSKEWAENGPNTLHGVIDYNFPNMFHSGPLQASNGGIYAFMLDSLSKHSAYILQQAKGKADGKPFAIAPTAEAAENWGAQVAMRSFSFAAAFGCTPSYFNLEGGIERIPAEKKGVSARSGVWGAGFEDFLSQLETWRAGDSMRDIDVRT